MSKRSWKRISLTIFYVCRLYCWMQLTVFVDFCKIFIDSVENGKLLATSSPSNLNCRKKNLNKNENLQTKTKSGPCWQGQSDNSWTLFHFPWHFGWTVERHRVGWESTPWPRQRPPRLSRRASTGQRAHIFNPEN